MIETPRWFTAYLRLLGVVGGRGSSGSSGDIKGGDSACDRFPYGDCDLGGKVKGPKGGTPPAGTRVPERSEERSALEVESVAYIVCDALGLDTSDYSFTYVARWSDGETKLVKDTAERVVACAKQILEGLGSASESETAVERAS